jgi:hypothetical protein
MSCLKYGHFLTLIMEIGKKSVSPPIMRDRTTPPNPTSPVESAVQYIAILGPVVI